MCIYIYIYTITLAQILRPGPARAPHGGDPDLARICMYVCIYIYIYICIYIYTYIHTYTHIRIHIHNECMLKPPYVKHVANVASLYTLR